MNCLRISFVIVAVFLLEASRSLPVGHSEIVKTEIVDSSEAKALYRDHYKAMQHRGRCSEPQERVIHIQNVLPDQTKRYVPECTVLHRCGSDTGCCVPGKICGPIEQEEVIQYFSVFNLNPNGRHSFHIEAITFMNHTRCGCVTGLEVPR